MKSIYIVIFLFCTKLAQAIPQIINYSSKDYKSHSINFDFVQDQQGLIYVANAYGVLIFDGVNWRKVGLNDGKSALSLTQSQEGKIFVGSSSEFGFLQKDERGNVTYQSLKDKMPDKEIGEINNIIAVGNKVFFQAYQGLYVYDQGEITKINFPPNDLLVYNLKVVNQQLYAFTYGKGFYKIKNNQAQLISRNIPSDAIISFQAFQSDTLWITKNGVYNEGKKLVVDLQNAIVHSCINITKNSLLLATQNNGLYHINYKGEILSNYNKSNGLRDNFIRKLFVDFNNDLWLAYNNGIGLVKWNSTVKYINSSDFNKLEGMGLASVIKGDTLFLGTTQGLFYLPKWKYNIHKSSKFYKINGLNGAINYLTIANNKLIACYSSEVYQINGTKAVLISDKSWYGSWIWKNDVIKNQAFVGNYVGLSKFIFEKNQWKFSAKIKGFDESSRVMEIDDRGIIWVVQGNKGLYRVELNKDKDSAVSVVNYATKLQLSPQHFNDIFKLNNTIYVSTYKGVFVLKNDELIEDKTFNRIKPYTDRIRKMSENQLYSIYNDQAHPLKYDSKTGWNFYYTEASFLESPLVGSAEYFNQLNDSLYIIGTEDGFALYQPKNNTFAFKGNCLIREINVLSDKKDSLWFVDDPKQMFQLKYRENNIRIGFSIAIFGESKQISYETKLLRNGKVWFNWQKVMGNPFREFTNLPEGKYTFEVKAKKGNFEMGNKQITFVVLPPWYRTTWAYVLYFSLLVVLVIYINNLFKKQRLKLIAEKQQELAIKEKLFHAEKLEIELQNKENELAYIALTYTQKKEILSRVAQNLDAISKDMDFENRQKIVGIKRIVEGNLDDESNWQNFQVHFDQKNDNFFTKLKQIDPKITEAYLLFCSYVKMGKSNKEIADLLNISVAAVEKRKYRLKLKWNIENDDNFTDFLREL